MLDGLGFILLINSSVTLEFIGVAGRFLIKFSSLQFFKGGYAT